MITKAFLLVRLDNNMSLIDLISDAVVGIEPIVRFEKTLNEGLLLFSIRSSFFLVQQHLVTGNKSRVMQHLMHYYGRKRLRKLICDGKVFIM